MLKLSIFFLLGGIALYGFASIRERVLYRSYKSFFAEVARRRGLSSDEALSAGPGILNPAEQREYMSRFPDQAVELKYMWLAKKGGAVLALVGGVGLVAQLMMT